MLKSNFSNSEPKLVTYRDYNSFRGGRRERGEGGGGGGDFKTYLDKVLRHFLTDYKDFKYIFMSVLNEYAPKKKKTIGGNH